MTDDKLRARYETWANAQNPPEGDCSCGQSMDSHSGGMALLHHDYHVVAALAASATDEGPRGIGPQGKGLLGDNRKPQYPDEGPDPAECAICGDYVAGGQPVHNICVAELTAKAEDARPAVPALDVERLREAFSRSTLSERGTVVLPTPERVAREYAALRSKEPTE